MVRHPDLGDVSRYVLKQDLSGCCMENAREKDWRPGSQRRGHCRSLKDEGVPGARAGIPSLVFIIFLSLPSHRNLCRYFIPNCLPLPKKLQYHSYSAYVYVLWSLEGCEPSQYV